MIISRGHQDAIISQKSVIQLACAVLETLELPSNKHWDQLASIEKVALSVAIIFVFWESMPAASKSPLSELFVESVY